MADVPIKKLTALLSPEHSPALRCAAVLVLAEVGTKDAELNRLLGAGLDDPDSSFRMQCLLAVGKLKIESALPQLLNRVKDGGPEAEAAAQSAARLGAKGTRALQDLMTHTAPGLRRRIAGALALGGTTSAETAAVDTLLDSDPGVIDAATRSLIEKIPTLPADHRRSLVDEVLELLKTARGRKLPLPTEAALVRVLSALADARGETAFWARVDQSHPIEVRAAALQALGRLPPPNNTDKRKRLLACAMDADFRVAAPAWMILKAMPVNHRTINEWLVLLDAPDPAARRFGIEKIGDNDTREVAEALARQLTHRDKALCDEALARLSKMKAGRDVLANAILKASTPEEAWALAHAQTAQAADHPPSLLVKIAKEACAYLESGDRRADALLALLREADAAGLRDRLEERAIALRKKKDYTKALIYLRLLTRDPACRDAIRFEQAACSLKLSPRDLSNEARTADHCLQQFAGLIHRHETDPAEMVAKAKWLEPEDLFFLGFHFAEGKFAEKVFGGKMLHLVVSRSPKSKLAKDAKSKLRSQGMD